MKTAIFEVEDREREPSAATIIFSDLRRRTPGKSERIKLIACRFTVFGHVDPDTCGKKHATSRIVLDDGSNTVAKHTFARSRPGNATDRS